MRPASEAAAGQQQRRAFLAAAAALLLLTALAFLPTLRNGFVAYDDDQYVTENAVVLDGVTAHGLRRALAGVHAANWHPLTWASHMLDVELFGLDPRGHHLTSLALHAAAAVLLLAALRALTGRLGASFLVAALFAVHPLRVESVAWVAERKDVLAGLLWSAALLAWQRYALRPAAARYAAALLLFALGLAAKPTVITLPFVLILLDWWPLARMQSLSGAPQPGGRSARSLLIEKTPFLALSLLAALITLRAQSAGIVRLEHHALPERVANAVVAYAAYAGKTLWPSGLAVFYPFVPRGLYTPAPIAAGAFLVAATAGALLIARRLPWILAGWFWYLGTLLPMIGLVQAGSQGLADRYSYLPVTGLVIAAAWSLDAAIGARRRARGFLPAAAGAVLLLLAALAWRQSGFWSDGVTLFRRAVEVTEGNWLAAHNLGYALDLAGDAAGAERWYRESLRIKPSFAMAHYHLALLLRRRGERAEALAELRAAVEADPGDHLTRTALALSLVEQGGDEEALPHLRESVRLHPDSPDGLNNLAVLLARRGETAEAARLLRRALALDPAYGDARRNLEALSGALSP